VHAEWRYAGETQWQRLSEQKLHIAEVKGDALALELRAVDTKDFASPANQGLLLVFADKDSYARREVRRLTGHADCVTSVAVTPDGQYVVSGSGDKTVRLWDLATGKEVRRFTGHENWVTSVAVTPDGQYVVSGSVGQHGAFVGAGDGARSAAVHGARDWVNSVAVTPDGKYVVSAEATTKRCVCGTWRRGKKCGGSRGTSVGSIASR
jgi:WD40 repeat protein